MADERHEVGDYLVVGQPGDYQIMERFGSFRITKKRFKTLDGATHSAQQMQARRERMNNE